MQRLAPLRFRLLLGLVKRIIFAVDSIPFAIRIPYRQTGQPRLYLSIPEVGEPVQIATTTHRLAGWFTIPASPIHAAVLLCHGIGDRLVYWRRAQQRLAQSGIASLVFHYSGYPGSGGSTTPAQLTNDVHAAYAWLRDQVPAGTPVFVLGFSLGTGLATEVAAALRPPPSGLILCEAFSTLRKAAQRITRPVSLLAHLLPDLWRTSDKIRQLKLPVLVMHSTGDALFPTTMAQEIHDAASKAGVPVELRVLDGHLHNAPYLTVPEDYWAAIVSFIRGAPNRNRDT